MGKGGMAGCGFSAFSLDSKDPTQPYRSNHPFTQQPQNRPLVSSSIRTFFRNSLIHLNLDFLSAEFWVVGGTTWLLDNLRFVYKVKFRKEVEAEEELASPFSFSTKRRNPDSGRKNTLHCHL